MINVKILTGYPEMFPGVLGYSNIGKALSEKIWNLEPTSSRGTFSSAFTNSAIVSIGTVVLSAIISTLAAYALTILRTPFRYL